MYMPPKLYHALWERSKKWHCSKSLKGTNLWRMRPGCLLEVRGGSSNLVISAILEKVWLRKILAQILNQILIQPWEKTSWKKAPGYPCIQDCELISCMKPWPCGRVPGNSSDAGFAWPVWWCVLCLTHLVHLKLRVDKHPNCINGSFWGSKHGMQRSRCN